MQRFSYTAYDDSGARVSGAIESESREAALDALFRQGRYPVEVIEGGGVPGLRWWEREVFGPRALSRRSLALITRELATLVKAEIPVDEALRIVAVQPLMPARARQVVALALARVLEGASLAEALDAQPGALPEFYARIVHAGETAGTLGQSLDELAGFLERSAEFRSRVGSALLYPMLLLLAAAGALAVILTILIPTIAPLFKEAGAQPPPTVQFLLDLQETISDHWFIALLGCAGLAAGLIALAHNDRWRTVRDRALLSVPLVSGLVQNGQTAIMARTLGMLIHSGVPMLQALQITSNALANRAMALAVHTCANEVKEGASLMDSLTRSGVFPELALRLIAVGERTGQLETMLGRVGAIYEVALQRQLLRVTSLLTPILTIVIGIVVGGLLLSVMGAIVSVNELAFK